MTFFSKMKHSRLLTLFFYQYTILYHYLFHTGDRYWVFSESILDSGYPKKLSEMGSGLPEDRIDAALYYTLNGQTFFFRGNKLVISFPCGCCLLKKKNPNCAEF